MDFLMDFLPADLIRKKRNGKELTSAEIAQWIAGYTQGKVPDYQMSAFLMAVYFRGMTPVETMALVKAMMDSGEVLTWPGHDAFRVDKHSTGGIGDKTSLILAPIVAAAGICVPMMSGRGLGHTGGTLDKLESIPGFTTQLSLSEFDRLVRENKIGMIGQTDLICPADKKMYALRDVTGTVESLPLVCASIMSKKIAEGINGLVLDVKYGNGAFFKNQEEARELAKALKTIGLQFDKKVVALLTNMDQPLGASAGNALEVEECLNILKGEKLISSTGKDLYQDTRDLSVELAAQMIAMSGLFGDLEASRIHANDLLRSGAALKTFELMISSQGGKLSSLPKAKSKLVVKAPRTGFISSFETERIGYINVALGAGRLKMSDSIDHTAGLQFHAKLGYAIQKDEDLVTIYGNHPERFAQAEIDLLRSIQISDSPKAPPLLILETL